MNIWIINPYGNLPGEGWIPYRSSYIADAAVALGHNVTWWVSNFEHRSKRRRCESWQDIDVYRGYRIRVVPSREYKSHVSLARIVYERTYARNVAARMRVETERPDLVVHGEPALFFSDITSPAIRSIGARLIIDVLDLWPELLAIKIPKVARRLGDLLMAPARARRSRFFRQADAFIAAAQDYLELAQRAAAGRPGRVVYVGVDLSQFGCLKPADLVRSQLGLPPKESDELWGVYAGTLGENYDLATIIRAAERLEAERARVRIIIAGDGPLRATIDAAAKRLSRFHYVGRVEPGTLAALYRQCDFGFSSYVTGSTVSMPVKAYDYLAAGLPLVNSLGRDLGRLLARHAAGVQYHPEHVGELAQAIRSLASSPALRSKLRAGALGLAKQFDVSVQYPSAIRFMEAVCAQKLGTERPASGHNEYKSTSSRRAV